MRLIKKTYGKILKDRFKTDRLDGMKNRRSRRRTKIHSVYHLDSLRSWINTFFHGEDNN